MGEHKAAEVPDMQALGMGAAARQPACHGVLTVAENPAGSRQVQASASAVST